MRKKVRIATSRAIHHCRRPHTDVENMRAALRLPGKNANNGKFAVGGRTKG